MSFGLSNPGFPLHYFGILIGDVIHNFRCVLDHIVWQLACYKTNGTGPPTERRARKVGFPIQVNPPSANIVPERVCGRRCPQGRAPRPSGNHP